MPNTYIAFNSGMSATTAINTGVSYSTGGKVAIQLHIPSGGFVELVEWGISFDVVPASAHLVEVASTATGSTCSSAHTTATVENQGDSTNSVNSRLTYGATTNTGYGNTGITSRTNIHNGDRQYLSGGAFVKQWPLGGYPKFGSTSAAEFLQLCISSSVTVNAICYLVWNELI